MATRTAYVSFYPGTPNAIPEAAEWLSEIYVGELLDGRVLTDFDEQVPRFAGAAFSLEQVMGGRVSMNDANQLLDRSGASEQTRQQFSYKIETLNLTIAAPGGVAAGPRGAAAGPGGAAAAGNSAAAAQGAAAAAGRSSARVGLAERVKASIWTKVFGAIAVISAAIATLLMVAGITDIGIAGYVVAIISIFVGVIPLFRD